MVAYHEGGIAMAEDAFDEGSFTVSSLSYRGKQPARSFHTQTGGTQIRPYTRDVTALLLPPPQFPVSPAVPEVSHRGRPAASAPHIRSGEGQRKFYSVTLRRR